VLCKQDNAYILLCEAQDWKAGEVPVEGVIPARTGDSRLSDAVGAIVETCLTVN
jgi:hypothetical protein